MYHANHVNLSYHTKGIKPTSKNLLSIDAYQIIGLYEVRGQSLRRRICQVRIILNIVSSQIKPSPICSPLKEVSFSR